MSKDLSWKKLVRADRETISLPFQLTLTESDIPLLCHEVLRIVPGKRLVVLATWGEQEIVAKLFYGRDAKRHIQQEAEGADIFQHANVPSPKLLYRGSTYKNRIQVILFEKINESLSLDYLWDHREQYAEINTLMHSFTIELATQHVLGILQNDLHLKNFLVTNNRIYSLDGSTIIQYETPLDKKNSIENLGLFFAQLGVGTKQLQQSLFQTYVKARGWLVKKVDVEMLQAAIKNAEQERWRRYQKKIFRNCTAFKKISTPFQSIMYDRDYQSPAFLQLLQNPDKVFNDPQTEYLKKGRSSTVVKINIDNRIFIIKRYNIKNIFHWLRRCLRATRAKSSWRLARRLSLFGISTAKPIAYIEHHFLGLRGKSYFLMEYIPGQHAGEFFSDYQSTDPRYELVAKRIVALLQQLSELMITHGDLKKTNIIIYDNQPSLIDLDGMVEHHFLICFQKAYQKEWERFMQNWEKNQSIYALFHHPAT